MSDFEDFKNQKQKAVKYSWRCTPRPRHVILRQSHSAPISARYSILRKRPEGPEKQKSAKHYQRIMARTASGKSIVGTTGRLLCVLVWRGFPPSSSTLSPPPPSLGGADAHAAALSGPQNLHLTHGGRSAADNHPPAAAFDTHKLQKRRTEREARKIQGQEHGQGQVLPLRNCGRGHSGSVAGEDPKIPAIYFLVGLDGRGPASRAPGALHLGDLALGPPHCFVCSNMRRARIDVIFDTVFMCTRYVEYA